MYYTICVCIVIIERYPVFLEEINNFCYEEFNDLLLEEDDDIFYLTKEVFENFKISFSANDWY